jgi:hypothetical protein
MVITAWAFATALEGCFEGLFEFTHETYCAFELRFRRVFYKSQVIRNHQCILDQKFSSLDVD